MKDDLKIAKEGCVILLATIFLGLIAFFGIWGIFLLCRGA